mmetsp:Transcript_5751/g.14373  ORF Transcript_5751/g.14373 Transcript_5751/m.14373 type:complete len:290 (-) Transcript_5751:4-873(-)
MQVPNVGGDRLRVCFPLDDRVRPFSVFRVQRTARPLGGKAQRRGRGRRRQRRRRGDRRAGIGSALDRHGGCRARRRTRQTGRDRLSRAPNRRRRGPTVREKNIGSRDGPADTENEHREVIHKRGRLRQKSFPSHMLALLILRCFQYIIVLVSSLSNLGTEHRALSLPRTARLRDTVRTGNASRRLRGLTPFVRIRLPIERSDLPRRNRSVPVGPSAPFRRHRRTAGRSILSRCELARQDGRGRTRRNGGSRFSFSRKESCIDATSKPQHTIQTKTCWFFNNIFRALDEN